MLLHRLSPSFSSDHSWFSKELMEVGILWVTVSTVQ